MEMQDYLNNVKERNLSVNAINKKYQSIVNRAVKAHIKYDYLNDCRSIYDDYDEEKLYNQFDRKCEKAYDKYCELLEELPSREVKNIEKIVDDYDNF